MSTVLEILYTLLGIGFILVIGEILFRFRVLKGEFARKFVHIGTALFAATWASYLSASMIAITCLIVAGVVVIVNKYNLFGSVHAVRRTTYGEIWYPLGIGVSALLFTNPSVYAIAVLHMGLADGLAAVVGVGMGKQAGRFMIGKNVKSVAGTATFIVTSYFIYLVYWLAIAGVPTFEQSLINAVIISSSSALVVATVELLSPKGSDNILVPIAAGVFAVLPTIHLLF